MLLDYVQPIEHPLGELWSGQSIQVATTVAAFVDHVVSTQEAQVLRYAGAGKVQIRKEGLHILFVLCEFFDNPDTVRMSHHAQDLGKLPRYEGVFMHLLAPRWCARR